MQISITNGTLTSIQETLSADSGYILPTSVLVAGAASSYNSSTGVLTLSNPTGNVTITASAVSDGRVSIDLTQLSGYASLAYGSYTLTVKAKATGYEDSAASTGVSWTKVNPLPQLGTPVISLDSDDLTIETAEGAEYCDIYVDGVLKESVPAVSGFNNITLTNGYQGSYGLNPLQYKLNDGQAVNVPEITSVVLNGVQKLEIYCENYGPIGCDVTVNGSTQYPDISTGVWADITSYLADNAVIEVYDND